MNSNNSTAKGNKRSWWQSRSKLEKSLILLAILACLLLLTLLVVFIILYPNKTKVCTSAGCVRTSMEILNTIDQAVDPCDNFYKFSCGTFIKNAKFDDGFSKSIRSNMNMEKRRHARAILEEPIQSYDVSGLKAAKKMYRACMNQTVVEKNSMIRVKSIFKDIGGWPTLDGNQWRENVAADWKDALIKLRKSGILLSSFLDIFVDEDKENPTKHILNIDAPYGSGSLEENVTRKEIEIEYLTDIAVILGAERTRAKTDFTGVFDLQLRLSKVIDESSRDENNSTSNRLTISELQYKYPTINWFEFINGILAPATTITYDDVIVTSPAYIQKLLQLLRNTSKRSISNFLCVGILGTIGHLLSNEINSRRMKFIREAYGSPYNFERWETCHGITFSRFATVISGAMIEQNYDQGARDEVTKLYSSIKNQFKHTIDNLSWMDETTKSLLREKLITSTESIVTKDNIYENDNFNNVYNDIPVYEDKLIQSVLNVDFLATNLKFEKLRQPVKNTLWDCKYFPTGFSLNYSPTENNMIIAAGLLQGIYFNKGRPRYINYGTLGSVIAHEISYIFTDAENPTTNAKLRDRWSTNTLLNYYKRVHCISEQFGQIYVDEIEQYLNSSNTQDKDVADQAGFKVSYEAYVKWAQENEPEPSLPGLDFTPNQLFWISAAMPLCTKESKASLDIYIKYRDESPDEYKVIGGLRNLEHFARDFNCPVASNMNPQEKCVVW